MGKIPQSVIDEVLERVDIVDIISGFVQLKQAGRSFKACCPFHNEKTPSFVVSPDKQIYHCFGCGAGGNSIGFLMQHEKVSFPEAVRALAGKVGVEVPAFEKRDSEKDSMITGMYGVNKLAAGFYQTNLMKQENSKILTYLKNRGLTSETLNLFRIGYALDSWDSFQRYARGKKISGELLRESGLSVVSSKGKNDYDRFRNRIIFPIFNERGNVQAFGARVLDNSTPKYINTPETKIYNKSSVLYGLNFAREEIRAKGFVVIVEGYLDVIIPFQYGVKNIVATSGTALTARQVALIKKYAKTAVMVYDADQAGAAASLRGLDILVANDVHVKIASLPPGEDPDSFVRKKGRDGFFGVLNKAKDLLEYKLEILSKTIKGESINEKGRLIEEMLPTIAMINDDVRKSEYLRLLSQKLNINETALRNEMGKVKPDYSYKYDNDTVRKQDRGEYCNCEIYIMGLTLSRKELFDTAISAVDTESFQDVAVKYIFSVVKTMYAEDDELNIAKLLSRLEGNERACAAVLKGIEKTEIIPDQEKNKALWDCIKSLKKERREEELKVLNEKLKEAQIANDLGAISELLPKIDKLHKEKITNC